MASEGGARRSGGWLSSSPSSSSEDEVTEVVWPPPRSGGWLSESSSSLSEDEKQNKPYSFPRHKTLELFYLCNNEGLLDLPTPASQEGPCPSSQRAYCLYHQTVGHVTGDCHVFKDMAEELIKQGVIDMGRARVNPPQPHVKERPSQATDVAHHSINVIHATISFQFPDPTEEGTGSNQRKSTLWYPGWRPSHQASFPKENTKKILDILLKEGRILVHDPPPTYTELELKHPRYCEYHARVSHPTQECQDLQDCIEILIQKGEINAQGFSMIIGKLGETAQQG
jgi:hypothetical protein